MTTATKEKKITPDKEKAQVTYEKIAERAYELWETRGCIHGCHVEDWLQAEKELLGE